MHHVSTHLYPSNPDPPLPLHCAASSTSFFFSPEHLPPFLFQISHWLRKCDPLYLPPHPLYKERTLARRPDTEFCCGSHSKREATAAAYTVNHPWVTCRDYRSLHNRKLKIIAVINALCSSGRYFGTIKVPINSCLILAFPYVAAFHKCDSHSFRAWWFIITDTHMSNFKLCA